MAYDDEFELIISTINKNDIKTLMRTLIKKFYPV